MFAAIPLFFAVQQAAEGSVWLTLGDARHATLRRVAITAFLGFALVVWPIWLPTSLQAIERDAGRRRLLRVLSWCGALVSIFATVVLAWEPPTAHVAGRSISYDYVQSHVVYLLGYFVPTVLPFFVATVSLARTLGVMLILSLAATFAIQRDALTSVWCFFASILSGLILVSVSKERRLVQKPAAVLAPPSC
jgi:hypothetical protein